MPRNLKEKIAGDPMDFAMDFAAEQKLCQLAHEVWLRAAAEPVRSPTDFADGGIPADVGVIVRDALHLRDVFPLEGSNAIAP